MRPRLVLLGLACALTAVAHPALAQRQRGDESWGKPGASFLRYRTDAVECAYLVGQQAPVDYPLVDLVFFDNMPTLDDPARAMQAALDSEKANFSRPWREVSGQLHPALAQCLTDRGYHRFQLTKDQVRRLRDFPGGSRARHVYLWNLSQSAAGAARR